MILSEDENRKLIAFQKMYYANAVLFLYFLLYEILIFSSYPNLLLLIFLKLLWVLSIIIYVFSSKIVPIGINLLGLLFSIGLGFQIQVFAPSGIDLNYNSFTYGTGVIILSIFCLTGMNIFYSLLSLFYIKVIYLITIYNYAQFQYTYFSLFLFIFLGITIGSIINDFFKTENYYTEIVNYWKDYSSNLILENLPKEYHIQNATSLFLDLTGIYNYYSANKNLKVLKDIMLNFYNSLESEINFKNINKFDDGKGHFWFVKYELPSNSDRTYAFSLADFGIKLRDLLDKHCNENNLDFSFRMGMDTGRYVDYSFDDINSVLKIFKSDELFLGAKEMESEGSNREIQVTQNTYDILKHNYLLTKRGFVNTENVQVNSYILQRRR